MLIGPSAGPRALPTQSVPNNSIELPSGSAMNIQPIPGTGSVKHLEENLAAAGITLDDDTYAGLEAAGE